MTDKRIRDFAELMREEEDKALEIGKAQIAKEDAAWAALTQEERDAINAARDKRNEEMQARLDEAEASAYDGVCPDCNELDCICDLDDGED